MPERIVGGRPQPIDTGEVVGPALTIALSDGAAAATWRVDVVAELVLGGRFRLGSFQTIAPRVEPPGARIVATAFCPGAQRWIATFEQLTGPAGAIAEVSLRTSNCCPGNVGVVPNHPYAVPIGSLITAPAVLVLAAPTPILAPAFLPGGVSMATRAITVQALSTNTDPVFFGDSTVTIGTGQELVPGASILLDFEQPLLGFVVGPGGGEEVRVMFVR